MTWQSGGGGGIKGVTSDGQTPGGEIVAGALTAGDPTAASVPTFHTVYGNTVLHDVVGNNVDDDDVLDVEQNAGLTGDSGANAVRAVRTSALNGHDFTSSVLLITDSTASTAPLATFFKNAAAQFQVDPDGVRIHDKFKTGAALIHVLGAYSGKAVPIYDESGTLLGYMPLYA